MKMSSDEIRMLLIEAEDGLRDYVKHPTTSEAERTRLAQLCQAYLDWLAAYRSAVEREERERK